MKNWDKAIISPNIDINLAIKLMNKVALRILLVCNKNRVLLGTVTDGDIRRALIDNIDLNMSVKKIMNNKPITLNSKKNLKELKEISIKNKILHIPIIEKKKLVNLYSISDENEKKEKQDNTVFILAGGFGKRLFPLTKKTPKPLIKIGNKAILDILIDKLAEFGFYNFIISTHYRANDIERHFLNKKTELNVNFVREKQPLGTIGSIGLVDKKNFKKPALVLNADLLTDINFIDLIKFHSKNKNDATVVAKKYDISSPYAELEVKNKRIVGLREKPNYSSLINAGIYVVNYGFIKSISGKNKIDMTELIDTNIKKKYKVGYYPIYEKWIDIGRLNDLKIARGK
jgi:dTDP-glucose pyrophosphorylase/predicted transcriptional regulator